MKPQNINLFHLASFTQHNILRFIQGVVYNNISYYLLLNSVYYVDITTIGLEWNEWGIW